jgi:hypothetical protein
VTRVTANSSCVSCRMCPAKRQILAAPHSLCPLSHPVNTVLRGQIHPSRLTPIPVAREPAFRSNLGRQAVSYRDGGLSPVRGRREVSGQLVPRG